MVRFAAAALALAATWQGLSAHGNEIVLLDFWSPTCGPCMQMKPTVQSLIDAGYPVRQIDLSREPELGRQYNITGIPCFVLLVDGQEIDRVVGATSSERLQQMFARARIRLQSPNSVPASQPAEASVPWTGVEAGTKQPVLPSAGSPAQRIEPASGQYGMRNLEAAAPPEDSLWTREIDARLLSASVRLRVSDAQGHSHGTGTIIDARQGEALVITCGHLFRESKGQGEVIVELFEAGTDGLRSVGKVPGQVLSYDLDRDVALLSIRPTRPVAVAPVAPPRAVVQRGDRAASVGCNNGQDPTILATRITWLDRYQGPPNIEASGAPVEGRSGGGLFNDQGQLVGVCFAADYEGNKGLYAGLESIHGELERLGMKEIYAKSAADGQRGGVSDQHELAASAPAVVRGQEPLAPVTPIPDSQALAPSATTVAIDPANAEAGAPQNLSATEQAAWDEIMSRAAKYEVVCIIRPKEPGGQSEVITLDEVSPEFARALAERQRQPEGPVAR